MRTLALFTLALFTLAVITTTGVFSQSRTIDAGAGDTHPIATVLGDTIIGSQAQQLTSLIFKPLIDRFAETNKLEPTPGELDTFVFKMTEKRRQSLAEMDKQVSALKESLTSTTMSAQEREQAEQSLGRVEKFRAGMVEMDKQRGTGNPEVLQEERESARQFVGSWKVNRALHKKYGGRVIFQQMGPEPVEAFRDFLRDQEKKGAFRILDTSHASAFWSYFVDEGKHSFYDKEEGDKLMTTPWWLMEVPSKK